MCYALQSELAFPCWVGQWQNIRVELLYFRAVQQQEANLAESKRIHLLCFCSICIHPTWESARTNSGAPQGFFTSSWGSTEASSAPVGATKVDRSCRTVTCISDVVIMSWCTQSFSNQFLELIGQSIWTNLSSCSMTDILYSASSMILSIRQLCRNSTHSVIRAISCKRQTPKEETSVYFSEPNKSLQPIISGIIAFPRHHRWLNQGSAQHHSERKHIHKRVPLKAYQ